ncbi:MAG: energy transducer TonB [Candidatus Didemnitutus sp.]|nr:energy transducer TonB [Candidatus Didemnitutus sp.]
MHLSLSASVPLGSDAVRTEHKYPACHSRHRDVFLALLCSAGLHVALLFGDALFVRKPSRVAAVRPEVEVVQLEMPVLDLEPETTELEEIFGDDSLEPVMAPPMLAEVPSITVSLFTQPLQPVPQTVNIGTNTLRIPTGRAGNPLGKGMGLVFDLDNIDQAPVVRNQVPPDYPLELRRNGTTGSVVVEFIVDREGNVISAIGVESTHHAFESSAVAAVKRWKFRPGKKAGRTVNTRVRQFINFNIDGS